MTAVTTVALLRGKDGMDAALFSKYWRDVHGMLATRIPGFRSYVQYHLDAGHPLPGFEAPSFGSQLHGIAVVDFDSEDKRSGLADSEVAGLIREDEINLFQSSLLYNLPSGADTQWLAPPGELTQTRQYFLLLRGDVKQSAEALRQALLRHPDIQGLRSFALRSGDAGHWQTPGVDNQLSEENQFDLLLQITGNSRLSATALEGVVEYLSPASGPTRLYPVRSAYVMVAHGRPTHLGLRGLDVLQTIQTAGADNQLDTRLLHSLYGVAP